jgi:hypothetical protein
MSISRAHLVEGIGYVKPQTANIGAKSVIGYQKKIVIFRS